MVELAERSEVDQFEGEDEEEQVWLSEPERQIAWESQAPSAFDLRRRKGRGSLDLQPRFQRRGVWDNKKRSKFIESILLDVPLPYFYLAEEADGNQVVVDGQQRLTAIFSYLDNEFVLQGLGVMEELNGKLFRNLDQKWQTKIEERALNLILIKNQSNEAMKYDVFERLNTGAVQLNPQELRNCVNRGRFNDLIIDLSENDDFQKLCGFSGPHNRMKDVEFVLRFFAFYHSYSNYKRSMRSFLDSEMTARKNLSDQDVRRMQQVFTGTVSLVKSVFGERAFRIYETSESGGRWRRSANIALQDVVMYGFAKRLNQRGQITRKSDSIREALINILVNDEKFIDSLSTHTSDEDRVKYRFEIWEKELDEILLDAANQGPRLFSLELKTQLFEADPTCKICGQRLHSLDDSDVDHIEPYWKGGRTIPENARLTHRHCNRARKRSGEGAG